MGMNIVNGEVEEKTIAGSCEGMYSDRETEAEAVLLYTSASPLP
jgi:hypothetical protein